jgi:hypothetical protein
MKALALATTLISREFEVEDDKGWQLSQSGHAAIDCHQVVLLCPNRLP